MEQSLVGPDTKITRALEILEVSTSKIVLVADESRRLLGTVTDGDVRRGILRGIALDQPVSEVMNRKPMTVPLSEADLHIKQLMQRGGYKQVPIVDAAGRVVDVKLLKDMLEVPVWDNLVVLMAGGFGTRLRPLTQSAAKPMLQVGDRPILETILDTFLSLGFHRFVMTLHYRAEDIIEYFGDGRERGAEIHYVRESEPMGTAGALRQLPLEPKEPLIVMNGDILTNVNFVQLLEFHNEHEACATMCVRDYDLQVPYGVVEVEGHEFAGIVEKPIQRFFVNAGIYALEPEALKAIRPTGHFDMPELYEALLSEGKRVSVFPIREYWVDIGEHTDLDKAKNDFARVFKS